MKVCNKCNESLPDEKFAIKYKKIDDIVIRRGTCEVCRGNRNPSGTPRKDAVRQTNTHKQCSKCKKMKVYNEFHRDATNATGWKAHCIVCILGHEPYKKEHVKEKPCSWCKEMKPIGEYRFVSGQKQIRYYICKKCDNKKKAEAQKKNRPHILRNRMYRGKLKKYGLTEKDYKQMLEDQNFKCAICKDYEKTVTSNGNTKMLSVDHCHTTGQVRGLLCSTCNSGIGKLKDNIKLVESALSYLKSYST